MEELAARLQELAAEMRLSVPLADAQPVQGSLEQTIKAYTEAIGIQAY